MATLLSFHAHPDDESIATAGTMAKATAAGHRVVLVVATRGDHGEPVPGVLDPGEPLGLRRVAETYRSADALGVERVEFLGYVDSGMVGTPTSEAPWSFCQTDVDHAAHRLAAILDEECPDVLTTYDDNGGYGHPDHIQVHRVGRRAAELAGVEQVFESTINRDHIIRAMAERRARGEGGDADLANAPNIEEAPDFGKPEAVITHRVDVGELLGQKRAAMRAHRSQMADDHFLLGMPDEYFAVGMGTEWYIAEGPPAPRGSLAAELFTPYPPSR